MKKSKAETAETRRRIILTAVAEFRRKGIHETSIADVMEAAGLTHGAFYRHFLSKDQLVAEACSECTLTSVEAQLDGTSQGDRDRAAAIVESYLSTTHRDDIADGCTFAALGSELARACTETRAAASARVLSLVDAISKRFDDMPPEVAKARAVLAVSAMVGAVTMSRIMTDPDMSETILDDTRKELSRLMQPG
ncbi:TetR/AcrR family transcriptional regulator [Acidisoma cellulosilytica]|uniref:TetR/AcrR family transcriptional regulator n=1 Tax=Acidisoma cellulosilyticum TaxID=2802395 RepID=A0A963Z1R4_9PROT|nr:TetR/AcrR family transcriptional regulator [Acidisoma cellulosilyticum]MCB8881257.1 TetR/AcrR family transcriptional regulator [Acidisoma cellulosilyticum]